MLSLLVSMDGSADKLIFPYVVNGKFTVKSCDRVLYEAKWGYGGKISSNST